MMLILIDLPNYETSDMVGSVIDGLNLLVNNLDGDSTLEIDPSVYVVDYGSIENGPAVFARSEDAEAFAVDRTEASVERVTIADAATAKIMAESKNDDDAS